MQINGLGSRFLSAPRRSQGIRTDLSAFDQMLSETKRSAQSAGTTAIHMYLPNENTIYSGGTGYQTVCAEYTADSTPEDPIVRVRGEAVGGEYDFICRINDINPENASYAELCALWGHLRKTGELASFQFGAGERPVIPYGVETGDITKRRNYMKRIGAMTTSRMFDQMNQVSAKELLEIYQGFLDKRRQKGEEIDSLLDLLDRSTGTGQPVKS